MAICNFFLQGRCRYGDRCWNEHPRGGRHQEQNRYQQPPAQGFRGSSNQRYVQPSSFSKSTTWTRDDNRTTFSTPPGSGDHRGRDFNSGPSYSQNRFSALNSQDHPRDTQTDKDGSLFDDIKRDLEIWESSGQWMFSVYCTLKEKRNLTGFVDISPEELRLECYTAQKVGNMQNYVNSVQQLTSQWKQRLHEIRNMNPLSQAALINDLTQPIPAATPMFGGQQSSGFGTTSNPSISAAAPSNISFSFKADSPNTGPPSSFSSAPGFGSKPSSGFGSAVTGSAASFSFAATTASSVPGFGNTGTVSAASFSFAPTSSSSAGASGFSSATTAQPTSPPSTFPTGFGGATTNSAFGASAAPAFGGSAPSSSGFGSFSSNTGFGAKPSAVSDLFKAGAASSASGSLFGQVSGVSVNQTASIPTASFAPADDGNDDPLFTPRSGLSAEELSQFESKKFTLTKIPRPPPPIDLLLV